MGSIFNLSLKKDLFVDSDEPNLITKVFLMEDGGPRELINDNSFWL